MIRKMLKLALCTVAVLHSAIAAAGDGNGMFERYFTDARMRVDMVFAGNCETQNIYLSGLKKEKTWSGNRKNLTDPFGYGEYLLEVRDRESGDLIYSKGFSTLFQEWRTTPESHRIDKAFRNSFTFPYPKEDIVLSISERVRSTGKFREIFSAEIDPSDPSVSEEPENSFECVPVHVSGKPEDKMDLLFIAEGYTADEMDTFISDAERFTGFLFSTAPYDRRKDDINVWALKSVSEESGTDLPHKGIWKKTVVGSTFYTFYADRYLTAPDNTAVYEAASSAPYDAVYVIVNTDTYGGGGIYNFYGLSMRKYISKNGEDLSGKIFVHEFGHSFAGLGDEYYEDETSYVDFYNKALEPWEPNLTTLVDFESKWKDMIGNDVPVPTPNDSRYEGVTGLFEGGGYSAKGIYRPAYDCRMKTNRAEELCPVCQRAIERMIDFYCR